jgi:MoxR-like ATPase
MSEFMGSLFNLNGPLKEWPSLLKKETIPLNLRSKSSDPVNGAVVGLGLVKALCRVLMGVQGTITTQQNRWSCCFPSSSTPAMRVIGGDLNTWWAATGVGYLVAVAAIVDAHLKPNHNLAREFLSAWESLVTGITVIKGKGPFTASDLDDVSVPCRDAMMHAVDCLYHYLKKRTSILTVQPIKDPSPLLADPAFMDVLLHSSPSLTTTVQPVAKAVVQQGIDSPLVKTLRRLIRRGGTALLVGPTGSGKTHAAKEAALKENCCLVIVKGRPGLDDRQFYGGVYPVGTGYQWVDGPLAESWRLAANQPIALLIDELARLDGYHLAALIGALDSVKGSELNCIQGTQGNWCDNDDYYLLTLPTGERLVAPAINLTIIATSNLGSDYVQVQQAFDPALLRRFALHLDVQRLEADQEKKILIDLGLPQAMAELLVAVEKFSLAHLPTQGGLLQRPLNIGTLLNWATEAKAMVAEGMKWPQAIIDAAQITAIPYCTPRMSDGTLEQPALKLLTEEIIRLTKKP